MCVCFWLTRVNVIQMNFVPCRRNASLRIWPKMRFEIFICKLSHTQKVFVEPVGEERHARATNASPAHTPSQIFLTYLKFIYLFIYFFYKISFLSFLIHKLNFCLEFEVIIVICKMKNDFFCLKWFIYCTNHVLKFTVT